MNEQEIWVPVNGYDGYYEVSNLARVKRIGGVVLRKNGTLTYVNERILSKRTGPRGYISCALYKNGTVKNTTEHRIVAKAFIPNPENKRTVNHKNGIKTDNRADNLEWATDTENMLHSYRELGRVGALRGLHGEDIPTSKAVVQLTKDGKVVGRYSSVNDTATKGFNSGHVSSCCIGRKHHNTHRGFLWKFEKDYQAV